MVIFILTFAGLAVGSLINAFVWRFHKNAETNQRNTKQHYSILHGRSVCTHCKTTLAPRDLIPVLSWISLRGRCRYCRGKIEDNPLAELLTAMLFVVSYIYWPFSIIVLADILVFVLWLMIVFLLVFLFIYDLRWMLLPDVFVFVFTITAITFVTAVSFLHYGSGYLLSAFVGGAVLFSFFYFIYTISDGKWIGGGDVKLLFGLGLLSGSALAGLFVVFLASFIGTLLVLPSLISRKIDVMQPLPFGPLLIIATFVVYFYSNHTSVSLMHILF